jgi:poly-gamma-glutamate synthesis protein (capsule biosynthesis protein)
MKYGFYLGVILVGGLLVWGALGMKTSLESSMAQIANSVIPATKNIKIEEKEKISKLILVGDIMLARGVQNQIKKNNDFKFPFLLVQSEFKTADLLFGNLEGVISDKGVNQGSVNSFRADPRSVEGLTFLGFDVLSLANNHTLDWGREALSQTMDLLEKNGIVYAGVGRDYDSANEIKIKEVNGVRIAFMAYTDLMPSGFKATEQNAGISDFNLNKIKEKIKEAKLWSDLVFISMHWGDEYQDRSNQKQQKIAHELIDAGVDVIVGHHPHVPEEIERYGNGWVIYSLGNFVFDQNFSKETMGGLMVEIVLTGKTISKVVPVLLRINQTFQPYFE